MAVLWLYMLYIVLYIVAWYVQEQVSECFNRFQQILCSRTTFLTVVSLSVSGLVDMDLSPPSASTVLTSDHSLHAESLKPEDQEVCIVVAACN